MTSLFPVSTPLALLAMNPMHYLFPSLVTVVIGSRFRGPHAIIPDFSFLETMSDDSTTTESPTTTTLGWTTVGTDEPTTFYSTTVSPTGNDISTMDPNGLVVNVTMNGSTVTDAIPAKPDQMDMCNCASANITTLLGCESASVTCTH